MKYDRRSDKLLKNDGLTRAQRIRLPGGSVIEIDGGNPPKQFRLKFSSAGDQGWWVDEESLGHLIAELLYLRNDIKEERDQEVVPVEAPFDDEEEEIEDDFEN